MAVENIHWFGFANRQRPNLAAANDWNYKLHRSNADFVRTAGMGYD